LKDKFVGALVGTAVGDALGMPVEGWIRRTIKKRFGLLENMIDGGLPAGHYTDDTQLMIGVAESLIDCKGFSGRDMAYRFLENFQAYRGYGPGTIRVLKQLMYGATWDEVGKHVYGGGSYGNGAGMRSAPSAVLYHDRPDMLLDIALNAARITHAHPLGSEGAMIQTYAVALAVSTDPGLLGNFDRIGFVNNLLDLAEEDYFQERLGKILEFLESDVTPEAEQVISALGNGVRAFDSIPTAIYCFLTNTNSVKDAVVYAVSLGGDTDTIGAMTGALSGALHGFRKIPTQWVQALENEDKGREYIIDLGERLYTLYLELQQS